MSSRAFSAPQSSPSVLAGEHAPLAHLRQRFGMAGAGLTDADGNWLAADGTDVLPPLPPMALRDTSFVGPQNAQATHRFLIAAPIAALYKPVAQWLVLWDHGPRPAALADRLRTELDAFAAHISVARMQAATANDRASFERAAKTARIGVWSCSLPDETLSWTDGVYDLFELPRGSAIARGQTLAMYTPASRLEMVRKRDQAIATCGDFSVDAEIITGAGRHRWIRITGTVDGENGHARRVFGMKQDITEEKLLGDETRRLAETDVMTGLANRARFQARLADPSAEALLLIDLDHFKSINDTLGHAAGDACLVEAARRLRQCCDDDMLVARIGGDEFAVILGPRHAAEATELAQTLTEALRQPFRFGNAPRPVGASVGIAYRHGGDAETLYRDADSALYAAKSAGRNTWCLFTEV